MGAERNRRTALRTWWARGALLATTIALGMALLTASWANYRGVQRAVATLAAFDPAEANELLTQARRSLTLGYSVAALLTLAAFLFWRESIRYEVALADSERRRRLSQLGEMAAILAHEIRNPLASLKGNAQLLAERLPADSRESRRADRVLSEAERLELLTADLLDFARSGPIDRKLVDPVGLVRLAAEETGIEGLLIEADSAPRAWLLDPARIRQALANLLRNAVEASGPGGAIIVRVTEERGALHLLVRDFGPGISEEARSRIFDPFYTTRTHGTGLGLAVAHRVVEMHGGKLSVEGPPGGGAALRIVLPPPPND